MTLPPSRTRQPSKHQPIPAELLREITRQVLSRITVVGAGRVKRVGTGVSIEVDRQRRPSPPTRTFRIASSEQAGSNKRWVYEGVEQVKGGEGYGEWGDKPDAEPQPLYNAAEDQNGTTGTYGNGITQEHLDEINDSDGGTDGTFDLVPVPDGSIVIAHRVAAPNGNGGAVEWWFDRPSGVQGDCPIPGEET